MSFTYLFALLITSAAGVASSDTVYVLPDLTVTATRLETSAFETTSRIEIVGQDAIREAGARSVADALQTSTGVFMRRYGRSGLATMSLRGTGASQTAILLDGRRISDPQLGQLDLSLLPASILAQIEVMSGASSPLYGGDGIGGAVNLRTLQPGEALRARMSAGAGAFGAREASLTVERHSGAFGFILAADGELADNDYMFRSRALDRDVRVRGADVDRRSLYGSARYGGGDVEAQVSLLHTGAERGLPSAPGAVGAGERQWDDQTRFWGDVRFERRSAYVKVGMLGQLSSLRYVNDRLMLDETGETRSISLDAEAGTRIAREWHVTAGVEMAGAKAVHPSLAVDARETRGATFLQSTGEIGRVMINVALRADVYRYPGEDRSVEATINPRLGISLPVSDVLRVRTSAGRGYRSPTFNDRFWTPGGNPDLQPEHGWTVDGGAVLKTRRISADLTAFHVSTANQIAWSPAERGIWTPANVSATRAMGAEAGVRAWFHVGPGVLSTRTSYTFTDTRDVSDPESATYGRPLRYVPRELLRSAVSFQAGVVDARVAIDYTGRRFTTTDGSQWLDPFATISLRLGVSSSVAGGRLSAAIQVENALDADYHVVANQPMPPRHAKLALTFETTSR